MEIRDPEEPTGNARRRMIYHQKRIKKEEDRLRQMATGFGAPNARKNAFISKAIKKYAQVRGREEGCPNTGNTQTASE